MKVLKFKGKMPLRNKLLIALVILIVIAVIGVVIAYIADEGIREWINVYVLRKEITEDDVATIQIESDKSQYIYAYNKYIVILCNGKLEIYNNLGTKVYEIEIAISNPIFDTNGSELLIAETGGQRICLVSDGKLEWETKVEGNISKINLGRNGNASIITEGTSYKSVIITFDKNGKEQFKTYLATTIAVGADLSIDGKYLAIAEVDMSGALAKSGIKIIEIEKASTGDTTNSVVYKQNIDTNKIITNVKYQEKGQLVYICDDSIHVINDGKDEKIIEFGPNTQMADINLKNYTVRAEEISKGLLKGESNIILTNIFTRAENTYEIEGSIKELTSYNQITAINLGTEVHLINLNGWLEKRYISAQEIKNIVLGSSVAGIIYRDRIKIITF